MIYGIILLTVVFGLLIWLIWETLKKSKKDWETLEYLEEKSGSLNTEEEIIDFHKELIEKSKGIHNKLVIQRMWRIDGYVRGLYKQFENK